VRSREVAGNRIANAHGDGWWRGVAFLDHIEVVIEGSHFVDLGHRHLHLSRERDEMRGRQAAEAILDLVQVLDQQVTTTGRRAEQGADVFPRLRIDSAALGCSAHACALAFGWDLDGHQRRQ
jgi:hypothetical protein